MVGGSIDSGCELWSAAWCVRDRRTPDARPRWNGQLRPTTATSGLAPDPDAQTAPAGSHGYGVADLNFLKGCISFELRGRSCRAGRSCPAGATEALCAIQATLSGGALTVMARVAANVGSGTTSSPVSWPCTSSSDDAPPSARSIQARVRTSAAVAAAAPALTCASRGVYRCCTSGWYRESFTCRSATTPL